MTDLNSLQITSVNDLGGDHAKMAFLMKTAEAFNPHCFKHIFIIVFNFVRFQDCAMF